MSGELVVAALPTVAEWVAKRLDDWMAGRNEDANTQRAWGTISRKVVQQTRAMCDRYSKIKTVAFPHKSVPLTDIYVPLTLINKRTRASTVVKSYPKAIFSGSRKALVVDPAGMGKSTVSRVIFLTALAEKRTLPILVDLRRLTSQSSLEENLASQFGISTKHFDLFVEFLTSENVLFLLDGFDEVSSTEKQAVSRSVRDFIDRSTKASFLITSRPDLPYSDYVDFDQFHIHELNADEAKSLIRKYGLAFEIEDAATELTKQIEARHNEAVSSFLRNPLLASLLLRSFEYKSVVQVKRGVFYAQVFDALFEAHDLNKETGYVRQKKTSLHHDEFHRALRGAAFQFRKLGSVEVRVDQFLQIAREITTSLFPDLVFSGADFLLDVTNAVPLLTRDGDRVRWAHKSLMEYFLADFLIRDYSGNKEAALENVGFGQAARENENFLVLVNEADPILFTRAITLPAIEQLLLRHAHIVKSIPADAEQELASDVALFFTSAGVVLSPGVDIASTEMFSYFDSLRSYGVEHLPSFTLSLIFHSGAGGNDVSMFSHNAALALEVPLRMGGAGLKTSTLSRDYKREGEEQSLAVRERPECFFDPATAKKKWPELEEEVLAIFARANSSIALYRASHLERVRDELSSLVKTSLSARSQDF